MSPTSFTRRLLVDVGAGAAIAAVLTVAPAAVLTAHADPGPDYREPHGSTQQVVDDMTASGLYGVTAGSGALVNDAANACRLLNTADSEEVVRVVAANTGLPMPSARQFVAIAIKDFCPWEWHRDEGGTVKS